MHLLDALIILENEDPERFHNVIVNIFDIVLKGAPMIPPHDLAQIELNIFLKVAAHIRSQVHMSRSI